MAFAIREALEAFAAPDIRDQILARALYVAGLEQVPERGPMLREFVDRFLRQAMETSLDAYSAELLVAGLDPIVRLAESLGGLSSTPGPANESIDPWDSPLDLPPSLGDEADWRSFDPAAEKTTHPAGFEEAATNQLPKVDAEELPLPESEVGSQEREGRGSANWDVVIDDAIEEVVTGTTPMPTAISKDGAPPEAGSTPGRAILFASRDPLVLQEFDQFVGSLATVMSASDPLTLLEVVQGPEPRPTVLVFDCESPSIQPATLAALAADFPAGASILLWRPDPTLAQELLSLNASGTWRACGPEWSINEVAQESLALIDPN